MRISERAYFERQIDVVGYAYGTVNVLRLSLCFIFAAPIKMSSYQEELDWDLPEEIINELLYVDMDVERVPVNPPQSSTLLAIL